MDKIRFYNIETNNLKGIDFSIIKNEVNCIIGPSGSGKSSLAFDTVNSVSLHEYNVMTGEIDDYDEYKVEDYKNLQIPVSLKQLNYNNNPRSTISTYYKIDNYFKYIFTSIHNMNLNFFSFNKFSSTCKKCKGLGYELLPDESLIIDYDASLEDIPFMPWKGSYRDLYKQLLSNISKDMDIPIDIPFRDLNQEQKDFLLYQEGKEKYKLNYHQSGRKRVKTLKYIGVVTEMKHQLNDMNVDAIKYSHPITCSVCKGTRFSNNVNKYKVNNKGIGEAYILTISDLKKWILECLDNKELGVDVKGMFQKILNFTERLIGMKLEYLNLNRSIASLSGGEFQRLRLSQLMESKFDNILYILDEPLSSLHISEKGIIVDRIMKLKKKNTLLIIEHDNEFIKECNYITALGPWGGRYGGNIIPADEYILNTNDEKEINPIKTNKFVEINSEYSINNVKPFSISLPLNTCIGVCGLSGSGKSTFAREILPRILSDYKYISQKSIRGNSYSIVASYINILDKIREVFSKNNNTSKSMFSFHYNSDGSCPKCRGTGKIVIDDYRSKYSYICPDCEGKRYSDEALEFYVNGLNINEVLLLEISEAAIFFENINKNIYEILSNADRIGLGYLKLSQAVQTLSGGENQRVKLLKHFNLNTKNKIVALDEPFQGLNNSEIFIILKILYEFASNGNTIIIIEHNIYSLRQCSYLIEFGEGSGEQGGRVIYSGTREDIALSKSSVIKDYVTLNDITI